MNIYINNKSSAPIYDQICSQIKNQIISGDLKEDEALPSIRNLAKDLRISVVTTKRAYDELEREGFIYTIAAKGCFVAPKNVELLREENLKKIEEHMQMITQLAASCNLNKELVYIAFDEAADTVYAAGCEYTRKNSADDTAYTVNTPYIKSIVPVKLLSQLNCGVAYYAGNNTYKKCRPRFNISGSGCDCGKTCYCTCQNSDEAWCTFSLP